MGIISDTALSIFLWPAWQLALLVVVCCVTGSGVAWFTLHVALRLAPSRTPQPPFSAAIIGVFALLLSFTVNEAWRRSDAAYGALLRESQEVMALLPLLDALQSLGPGEGKGGAVAGAAKEGLREYLGLSLAEEWGRFNTVASGGAGAALERVRDTTAAGLVLGGTGGLAWRSVMDRLDGVQQGRTARLVAGGLYGDGMRWAALFALYMAGAFALAAVHLDRRGALGVVMPVYTFAACVTLTLAALSEQPYTGWDAIQPDRLVAALGRFGG